MAQYIGEDGKEYSTFREMVGADEKFRNIKRQTELLDEQNKLMQEQNNNMQKGVELNKKLQEEKMLNDRIIAEEKMAHDKEMRILGLFDSAGLNKKFYDEFVSYLFSDDILDVIEISEKNNNIIIEFNNYINLINDYFNKKVDFNEVSKFVYDEDDKDTLIKTKKLLEDFLHSHNNLYKDSIISNLHFNDNEEFYELNEKVKKYTGIGYKYAMGAAASLFIGLIFSSSNFIGTLSIISVLVCAAIALFYLLNSGNKKLFELMDNYVKEHIENIEKELNNYNDSKYVDDILKKQVNNFKKEINKLELENKNNESKLKDVKVKWNDFVKFRKNNYNSTMESLFIEAGLEKQVNSLGLDYCRINNDNKNKNGTVEDYIAYFNSFK